MPTSNDFLPIVFTRLNSVEPSELLRVIQGMLDTLRIANPDTPLELVCITWPLHEFAIIAALPQGDTLLLQGLGARARQVLLCRDEQIHQHHGIEHITIAGLDEFFDGVYWASLESDDKPEEPTSNNDNCSIPWAPSQEDDDEGGGPPTTGAHFDHGSILF